MQGATFKLREFKSNAIFYQIQIKILMVRFYKSSPLLFYAEYIFYFG